VNTKRYAILLAVTVALAIGGVLTLVPAAGASYDNVLGYRSLCTFAPAASLYCFAAAGLTCVLRASLVKRAAYNGGKPAFRVAPIVVVLIVLCLAVVSHLWFSSVKSTYTDGLTAVTAQE
jgi:uncharacterized membrane protein